MPISNQNNPEPKKAIIYCRVSTEDQAISGGSLASQEAACKRFAADSGYSVDKAFIERGESAKTQNRTEFKKMLGYCAQSKRTISAVIVWKTDRLTRNLDDLLAITKNLSKIGISVLTVTETNGNDPEAVMIRNLNGVFAQYETDKNSERTKAGMIQAIKEGRWLHPLQGYEFRDYQDKRVLFPDKNAGYIKKIFELALKGIYSQEEIRRRIKLDGYEISKQTLNKTLRNPVYAGLLPNPDTENDGEKYIKAIHEPLITQEIFFKVQAILDGKRPAAVPKQRNNPEFPLRRYLKCHVCGRPLTGSKAKGRFPYYHCMNKGCPRFQRDTVESKFYEYLKSIQPNPELLNLFEKITSDVYQAKTVDIGKTRQKVGQDLKKLNAEKARIRQLIIAGTLSEEDYKIEINRVNIAIEEKNAALLTLVETHDFQECWDYCKAFIGNIAQLWKDGDLAKKQRFQSLIFPEGLYFDGKNIGTAKLSLLFQHFYALQAQKSNLGWLTGFEPATFRATAGRSNH